MRELQGLQVRKAMPAWPLPQKAASSVHTSMHTCPGGNVVCHATRLETLAAGDKEGVNESDRVGGGMNSHS